MPEYFVGLMSGTSMDGADGIVAAISDKAVEVLAHASLPFPESLRAELLALNRREGQDELHRACVAGVELARLYAEVVRVVLGHAGLPTSRIRAIGAHGQTVRHLPDLRTEGRPTGFTLQLNQPALLAELTGIAVVCDFRSRDIAAGGQGAPLVPLFHLEMFAHPDTPVAVLNIGGIANLTVLPALAAGATGLLGFDCGPGNLLMDAWCLRHLGQAFDRDGAWAASGMVLTDLLAAWLSDPYFRRLPPKSTGRDDFHLAWMESGMQALGRQAAPQDVQATLCELTALTCAQAMHRHAASAQQLRVCGGGVANGHLMRRLTALLPGVSVGPTDDWGLPAQQVEATAFAWLAQRHVHGKALALGPVTGAKAPRVLGAYYPA